jgi:hypothetical protein
MNADPTFRIDRLCAYYLIYIENRVRNGSVVPLSD